MNSSYNILIAEDEPLIRMDLKGIIEEYGYNVIADVDNGKDAVRKARSCGPDPGYTGYQNA